MPQDTVGYHAFINIKALNTECWDCLLIWVYLLSRLVAHLSQALTRELVVTGGSARIQDKTTESPTWFFNMLGEQHHHKGPQFKVSSERQLIIVRLKGQESNPQARVFKLNALTN